MARYFWQARLNGHVVAQGTNGYHYLAMVNARRAAEAHAEASGQAATYSVWRLRADGRWIQAGGGRVQPMPTTTTATA